MSSTLDKALSADANGHSAQPKSGTSQQFAALHIVVAATQLEASTKLRTAGIPAPYAINHSTPTNRHAHLIRLIIMGPWGCSGVRLISQPSRAVPTQMEFETPPPHVQ